LKTDDLRWIRIFDPVHIPKKYVEQIKDRPYTVDKFYQYQKSACLQAEEGRIILDPTNLLFVIADAENLVRGFCWMVVDTLCNALVVQSFSMDPEYWCAGTCVPLLEKKAKEIQEGAQLDKVWWVTRSPKHSEKYGFKRSKHVLMEYTGHGSDINWKSHSETDGQSGSDDSATTTVP